MAHTQATRYAHVKNLGAVVVIKPHGDLTGGPETDELDALIDQFNSQSVKGLVINLAAVSMMNSLALSRLIRGHMRFAKRGARMVLCSLDRQVENIFVVTKLSLVFAVFPDEELAIAGCAGGPE
ncbi:MAG TPA: STAS domain-containing protein [Candidatus Eisenbacteria bacterium]